MERESRKTRGPTLPGRPVVAPPATKPKRSWRDMTAHEYMQMPIPGMA